MLLTLLRTNVGGALAIFVPVDGARRFGDALAVDTTQRLGLSPVGDSTARIGTAPSVQGRRIGRAP